MAKNTRLSVNINKIATLRNARDENMPDVLKVALDCEKFGAQGITVHPRPDERHIRRSDVFLLADAVTTEFNIEGYPADDFVKLVLAAKPAQVTLVPDAPEAVTSNSGWDVVANRLFLANVIKKFKDAGIRVSIFVEPVEQHIVEAAALGADRVELYTKPYASLYASNRHMAVKPYAEASRIAHECGLGVNAGHDLNLENLAFLHKELPWLDEVSIGHALICDALYMGLKETIGRYLDCLAD